jgi:phosphate-selective porin
VGQVKTNSKLNLISPRSFKFPGEKLLKKIGSASISKEKENTLTLSTSVATRRGRPKRHHSLDDLDDSMRRNVSFGRKGNKARDAIASDSEEDKASLWDGSYGDDDTSSSHSSDTDSGTLSVLSSLSFVSFVLLRSLFLIRFLCAVCVRCVRCVR